MCCILAQLLDIVIDGICVGAGSRAVLSTLAGPVDTGVAVEGKEGYGIGLVGVGVRAVISTLVRPVHTGAPT